MRIKKNSRISYIEEKKVVFLNFQCGTKKKRKLSFNFNKAKKARPKIRVVTVCERIMGSSNLLYQLQKQESIFVWSNPMQSEAVFPWYSLIYLFIYLFLFLFFFGILLLLGWFLKTGYSQESEWSLELWTNLRISCALILKGRCRVLTRRAHAPVFYKLSVVYAIFCSAYIKTWWC